MGYDFVSAIALLSNAGWSSPKPASHDGLFCRENLPSARMSRWKTSRNRTPKFLAIRESAGSSSQIHPATIW